MRQLMRVLLISGSILGLILILSPLAVGFVLAKQFPVLMASQQMQSDQIQVELVDYQRGWFTSHAVTRITLKDPKLKEALAEGLGYPKDDFPDEILFNITLEHGPFFYRKLSPIGNTYGLAVVREDLQITPKVNQLLNTLGLWAIVDQDYGYIGLNGKYSGYLKLSPIRIVPSNAAVRATIGSFEAFNEFSADGQNSKVTFKVDGIGIYGEDLTAYISNISMNLAINKRINSLMIGSFNFKMPEWVWLDNVGNNLVVTGLQYQSASSENGDALSLSQAFMLGKITYNDEDLLNSITFKFSGDNVVEQGVVALVDAYRDFVQHGDLYQSQFQQKVITLLPQAVKPGTRISIDDFSVVTPKGKMNYNGSLTWPTTASASPEDMQDLVRQINVKMDLLMTKPFADGLMKLLALSPYIAQPTPEMQQAYADAADQIALAERSNRAVISGLVADNLLLPNDARALIALQQSNATLDDYSSQINYLLLHKRILLNTSYDLYVGYLNLTQAANTIQKLTDAYQEQVVTYLKNNLDQLIKAGYIMDEGNNYTFTFEKDGATSINLNGRQLQQ